MGYGFKWVLIVTLTFVVIAFIISILNFDLLRIPDIVSYIGWIIVISLKLSYKANAYIQIKFKGFFADTITRVNLRITKYESKASFLIKLRNQIEKSKFEIISFPIGSPNEVEVIVRNREKFQMRFRVSGYEYDDSKDIFVKFEGIHNRHAKVYEYCERVNEYIKIFQGIVDSTSSEMFVSINVEYPNKNNPVLSALANNTNINMQATGSYYKINKSYIDLNGTSNDFLAMAKDSLIGNVHD